MARCQRLSQSRDTAKAMQQLLHKDFPEANDFGGEIIPLAAATGMKVVAYLYDGYWEDIGTVDAFFHANLSCNDPNPQFSFYDLKRSFWLEYASLRSSTVNYWCPNN